jgi:ribosomal protein S2
MGEIVNLRTVRKRMRRQQETDAAAKQRMQHGLPKAERLLSRAQEKLACREHDQHRIESERPK